MSSDTVYIAYNFDIIPLQPTAEILIAELGEIGFEGFIETKTGLSAYILKSKWDAMLANQIHILGSKEFDISYSFEEIEQTNWNAEWEANFNPIIVDNRCTVRASFHPTPDSEYDIIIEPKMSFGTGHHETTYMMIQQLLEIELSNKYILDMGCGTAVLAILAEFRGASQIDAIDIDHWCYLNSLENVKRNKCNLISVYEGGSKLLKEKCYEVILANINRNVLIKDMSIYASSLKKDGILILSGFYASDVPQIEAECNKFMLKKAKMLERNNWISLKFIN